MKTNVTLTSSDRELFGVTIRQQTKTGFLNLSDLQDAYTHARVKHGWSDKRTHDILISKTNAERIYYVLEKQGVIKTGFPVFMNEVEKNGITTTLKKYNAYKTTGARQTKTTWTNPYIWVLVAMELNPMLYATTVMWLTDRLIINRIEAGNLYKDLARSVSRLKDIDYVKLAKALNYVVFNRHETGIRNFASQKELKEMELLETKMAYVVDMGFVNSFDELVALLRKEWHRKFGDNKKYIGNEA